jgi:integrase/recombinase XerD
MKMALTETSLIKGFFDYQGDVRKLHPRTLIDMKCTYGSLQDFCENEVISHEIWELSLKDYIHWVNWLQKKKQATKSINKMLSHVRRLIDYAWQIERLDRNVLAGFFLKSEEVTPIYDQLTIEEARKLVTSFGKQSKQERRLRTVMVLLYGCGLRTMELCGLDVGCIDVDRQELQVIGKGAKRRVIPISDAVFAELLNYLRDRNGKRGALFRTEAKGVRVSEKDILRIVAMATQRCGLKKAITPRTLRHAFASHLLDQGIDISVISTLMGHRSPSETGVYIHAQEKNLRAAVFKMSNEGSDL